MVHIIGAFIKGDILICFLFFHLSFIAMHWNLLENIVMSLELQSNVAEIALKCHLSERDLHQIILDHISPLMLDANC